MTRAIVTAFHQYQPYGEKYYEPILDFYLHTMKKYESEYDHIYLLDSTWGIDPKKIEGMKASIHKVSPHDRYFDAYKKFLPEVKEDLVLFIDNDTVVYQNGCIDEMFFQIDDTHTNTSVIGIYDTIGEYKTDKMNGKNKLCPYWIAARKDTLMKYNYVDWGDNMPHSETLGKLTEAMINDDIEMREWPEDKNSIYFDGVQDSESSKNTGVYHIRAGSTPAVLLAWKDSAPNTYREYLSNQPKREYLRQCAWYQYMGGNPKEIVKDSIVLRDEKTQMIFWNDYYEKFKKYHGL